MDGGGDICESCFEDYYFECPECGFAFAIRNAVVHHFRTYCRTCFEDTFIQCSDCKEYVREDDTTSIEGKVFCEDCTPECDVCSQNRIVNSDGLCEECEEIKREKEKEDDDEEEKDGDEKV
jgi:hypothetical protein